MNKNLNSLQEITYWTLSVTPECSTPGACRAPQPTDANWTNLILYNLSQGGANATYTGNHFYGPLRGTCMRVRGSNILIANNTAVGIVSSCIVAGIDMSAWAEGPNPSHVTITGNIIAAARKENINLINTNPQGNSLIYFASTIESPLESSIATIPQSQQMRDIIISNNTLIDSTATPILLLNTDNSQLKGASVTGNSIEYRPSPFCRANSTYAGCSNRASPAGTLPVPLPYLSTRYSIGITTGTDTNANVIHDPYNLTLAP